MKVTTEILRLLAIGMNNRNPDKTKFRNDWGPNAYDAVTFEEYEYNDEANGGAKHVAKALMKYVNTQLQGVAAEVGLPYGPSKRELSEFINGEQPTWVDEMIIYPEELELNGEPRLGLRFSWGKISSDEFRKRNADLKADMRDVKAHYMWNPALKVWHIPNRHYMVDRALGVLLSHGFDCARLEPYAVEKLQMRGSPDSWFQWTLDEVGIKLPYDENLVEEIKCIDGRRWDTDSKRWFIPIIEIESLLHTLEGYNLHDAVAALQDHPQLQRAATDTQTLKTISSALTLADFDGRFDGLEQQLDDVIPDSLNLRPFQKAGVAFIELTGGKALIGDEMGTGKTWEAIAWTLLHDRSTLIVAPASLKVNWVNELTRLAPDKHVAVYFPTATKKFKLLMHRKGVQVLTKNDDIPSLDYLVVNYEAVQAKRFKNEDGYWDAEFKPYAQKLSDADFGNIIFDECHNIKNPKSQRAAGSLKLARSIGKIVALSGTPIMNRPIEFFTTLKLLKHTEFNNWETFVRRYCDGYEGRYGWQVNGASNTDELHDKVRSVMIRRTKEQVLADLPDKIRQRLEVEMDNQALYHRLAKQKYNELGDDPGSDLVLINFLRQEAARQKVSKVIENAVNIIDSEGSVVVFYHHHEIGDTIADGLREAGVSFQMIDGRTPMDKRQGHVDAFQGGEIDALVCGVTAAGQGLTMTRASTVVFAERSWVPGIEWQAEDRLHRLGQQDVVNAVYISALDSIDEHFDSLIEDKSAVLSEVLDGAEWQGTMIPVLIASIKERYS